MSHRSLFLATAVVSAVVASSRNARCLIFKCMVHCWGAVIYVVGTCVLSLDVAYVMERRHKCHVFPDGY